MTVFYEWDCETVADGETDTFEDGEVIDHAHGSTLADVLAWSNKYPPNPGEKHQIVLVRDDDDGRSWAYLEGGRLPSEFTDAYYTPVAKVPKRFHAEVERMK